MIWGYHYFRKHPYTPGCRKWDLGRRISFSEWPARQWMGSPALILAIFAHDSAALYSLPQAGRVDGIVSALWSSWAPDGVDVNWLLQNVVETGALWSGLWGRKHRCPRYLALSSFWSITILGEIRWAGLFQPPWANQTITFPKTDIAPENNPNPLNK